jgi:hypothetical protein
MNWGKIALRLYLSGLGGSAAIGGYKGFTARNDLDPPIDDVDYAVHAGLMVVGNAMKYSLLYLSMPVWVILYSDLSQRESGCLETSY